MALFPKWKQSVPQEDFNFLPEPPPIATIPKPALFAPAPTIAFDPVAIMQQVTKLVEKYVAEGKEHEVDKQKLQIELTEALLAQETFRKKIDFLELENIELRNNLQTSEAANYDKTRTLESLRSALDGLGIQKRTRNGKRKEEKCDEPSSPSQSSSPAEPAPPAPLSAKSAPATPEAIGVTASSTATDAGTEVKG